MPQNPADHPIYKIALDIVEMSRKEDYMWVYDKYFTESTRAVEAFTFDWSDPVNVWISAIKKKVEKWDAQSNVVWLEVSQPSLVNWNQFIVWMEISTKDCETWAIKKDAEYVLYTIEDGKVAEERFFYCP